MTRIRACRGCGAEVPDVDGPVHKYVPLSPGCWQTLGEMQADEARRFGYPSAHRVVVDAYMAQHAGDGSDGRDRQSVFVHLVGLCAVLEHDSPHTYVTKLLGRLIRHRRGELPVLERFEQPDQALREAFANTADEETLARIRGLLVPEPHVPVVEPLSSERREESA